MPNIPDLARALADAAEAVALDKAATAGPWYSDNTAIPWTAKQRSPFTDQGASVGTSPGDANIVCGGAQDEQGGAVGVLANENAAFIATARELMPRLAAHVTALAAEVERLRGAAGSRGKWPSEWLKELDAAVDAAWESAALFVEHQGQLVRSMLETNKHDAIIGDLARGLRKRRGAEYETSLAAAEDVCRAAVERDFAEEAYQLAVHDVNRAATGSGGDVAALRLIENAAAETRQQAYANYAAALEKWQSK